MNLHAPGQPAIQQHFKRLSRHIIIHISKFVTGVDLTEETHSDTQSTTKNHRFLYQLPDPSEILPISNVFKECREYYTDTIDRIKLRHYLGVYSSKYWDVMLLAYKMTALFEKTPNLPQIK